MLGNVITYAESYLLAKLAEDPYMMYHRWGLFRCKNKNVRL